MSFVGNRTWPHWLVDDQREASGRPDVLTYVSDVAHGAGEDQPGSRWRNLVASTSGTDSDWVVKLIDVYPAEVAAQPEMGGYQLMVAADIFRGRYRESFETPQAHRARTRRCCYRFALPDGEPRLPAGAPHHGAGPVELVPALRPQPADVRARTSSSRSRRTTRRPTQRVYHAPGQASYVELPLVKAE